MEPAQARGIANGWYGAAEEIGAPKDLFNALARELSVLLSADAQTGIGFQDGEVLVLAIDGERFVCIGVHAPAEEEESVTFARSLSLSGAPSLDVSAQRKEENDSISLVRTWTLRVGNGEAIKVSTRVPVTQSFAVDRGGEALMMALARKLGWPIPGD